MTEVDLTGVNLNRFDLSRANLRGANIRYSDLTGANFSFSDLTKSNLVWADCSFANFYKTYFFETVFGNTNLNNAENLEFSIHGGPNTIDHRTIIRSGKLPIRFLQGCGLTDWQIAATELNHKDLSSSRINEVIYKISNLLLREPIQYFSCFISYASKDEEFVEKLYNDLQKDGIRCWYGPKDIKIGDNLRLAIDEAIIVHDKLLLILSQNSIISHWVEQEVEKAFERERKENSLVLFPLRIDNTVFINEKGWASYLKNTRHIGDFTNWKDKNLYQKSYNRLIQDLKT
ncbi:MAG: hypothetical protein CV087_22090 [Candidatus Brocadia sp. WS118]|nr:MAG: hypothetical protein CV087_22090 [Candidatus Brocadia sp. WS118]